MRVYPGEEKLFADAAAHYVENGVSAREAGRVFEIGKDRITTYLKENGLLRKKKDLTYDETFFDVIDTEQKAYWLGFLFADGHVSKERNMLEITIKGEDKGHLEKFKRDISFKGDVTDKDVTLNGKIYPAARIALYGQIKESLMSSGYTLEKRLRVYPNIPIELDRYFIRGYFDGDGSIYKARGNAAITIIGYESFLTTIQDKLIGHCGLTKVKLYNQKKTVREYKKERSQALKILHFLYDKSTVYLDRKYNKYLVLATFMSDHD